MYEYPPAVVLRIIAYSTSIGMVVPDTFVNRPAEYDRPVIPIDCAASAEAHSVNVRVAAVIDCVVAGFNDRIATCPTGP